MKATQIKSNPINSNVNNNTNHVNVNVKVESPKKRTYNKKRKYSWVQRAVVGALITVCISCAIYYIRKGMDSKSRDNAIAKDGNLIEANK